ncbi:MAG: glycosyltransferase family 2 protein [Verrucomicrobia bacterium]|nr:glycosyltransferase family 2 protein [Verrucomicrobiota bacterium]
MNEQTAVVVVTWNKLERVRDCLRSLAALPEGGFDVFVVDNASTDGTAGMVRDEFPGVELLVNAENLGGSGGFNRGMRHAFERGYGLIWLLDNDVTVEPGALDALRETMAARPDCGIVGSKIYAAGTGLEFIQELGSFIDWANAGIRLNRNGEFDHGRISETVEVDYVPACSLLVRARALARTRALPRPGALEGLELFDPSHFLYWDDIDFCHRMTRAGWKVLACGRSVVNHFSSGERAGTSTTIYYNLRNSLRFVRQYVEDENAFRATAQRRLERAAERAGLFVTLGRHDLIAAKERGVRDALDGVHGRIDDLDVVPLAAPSKEPLAPLRTLVLVAQRPHIFHQCRPWFEGVLDGSPMTYLVEGSHLDDVAAMERSNVVGHDGEFRAGSPELRAHAGRFDRVVMLGKDSLFVNVVEAALSLGARETLYVDFYGNMMPLDAGTLDEHRRHAESFRTRWLAALDESNLIKAREQ